MSQKSLAVTSTGKLVTLISGELQAIEKTFYFLPSSLTIIISILGVFVYIGVFFEEASAISFGVLILMIATFVYLCLNLFKWIYNMGVYSDKRINHITDIVNGIKTIKAYCWEHVFEQKVRDIRDIQLSYAKKIHYFMNFGSPVLFFGGYFVILTVISYHYGIGRKLEYSSSIVLISLGIYLSIYALPTLLAGLNITLRVKSIFQRVDEVMNTNDKHENANNENDICEKDIVVCLKNVTATWGFQIKQDIYSGETEVVTDEPTNNLIDITFDASKQDFIAVVGPVGCGKTTLLNTIMKELEIKHGDIFVAGSL